MSLRRSLAITATLVLANLGSWAHAGFVYNVTQAGSNVVITGSGSIDTTDLTSPGAATSLAPRVEASAAILAVGPGAGTPLTEYTGVAGPLSFGTGGSFVASSGSGDFVTIFEPINAIYVPFSYVSGSFLSNIATFNATTIAALGLTPGTYTYTWGSGSHADSLTINIGIASVPEPSSLTLATIAIAGGLVLLRRRRGISRPETRR